jgi:predicted protein tyrosine phosphatase
MSMNRKANAQNKFQGTWRKCLCVCSAGILRSPTAAVVLSQPPFMYNTRAVGIESDFALIPVDEVLLDWADEIVCMDKRQEALLKKMTKKKVICLNIPDQYEYRSPELNALIRERYDESFSASKQSVEGSEDVTAAEVSGDSPNQALPPRGES